MNFYNIRKEHGTGVSNTFLRTGWKKECAFVFIQIRR